MTETVPYGKTNLDKSAISTMVQNLVLSLYKPEPTSEEEMKRLVDEALTPLSQSSRLAVLEGVQKEHDLRVEKVAKSREELKYLEDMDAWCDALPEDPKIEKNDCTRLHKFQQAVKDCKLVGIVDGQYEVIKEKTAFIAHQNHTFVVRHDWASAFAKSNIGEDEIRIPYDLSWFEFRVAGRTLICMAFNVPEEKRDALFDRPVGFHCFAECGEFWVSMGGDHNDHTLMELLWSQIKAICIALDAEVATSEVVRQSEKLNRKRIDAGKLPLADYHVVDLSKRHRVANPATLGGTHKSPRLHFVRGHWRHLENARVWIKWHLRGDPDLGYIQKEYSL